MEPLSAFILTKNSEKYLFQVLQALKPVADEIVVVDSGSQDGTLGLAENFGVRVLHREFDNFCAQRAFAVENCQHEWVFFVDSDEVIDKDLQEAIVELKRLDFNRQRQDVFFEGFKVPRRWYVFGREVRAFLPVTAPDAPIRLFHRGYGGFQSTGRIIHEEVEGLHRIDRLNRGYIHHYSVDSLEHLFKKLNQYTSLAALDKRNKGQKHQGHWANIILHSVSTWAKWYLQKGGWRDGEVGFLLGVYAFLYGFLKYAKLRFDQ